MTVIFLLISLLPILGVFLAIVYLFVNPSKWRLVLPFLIYGFFVGAYAFVPPDDGFDLCRYLPLVEEYGKLSFIQALLKDGDVLYSSHIIFWVCGKLRLPHLAPAITTAAVYGCSFYMTCDTAEKYDAKQFIAPLVIIQAAMMPYIMIINNVRNVFGLVLVAFAAYLELVKKNRKWYVFVLYLFGGLSHLSALVFIFIRIICGLSKKIFGVIILFPIVFPSVIIFLNSYIDMIPTDGAIGKSVRGIIWRMYGYLTYRDIDYAVAALNSKTVKIDRIIMFIGMIAAIIVVYYLLNKGRDLVKDDLRIYSFIGLVSVMTISCNVFAMPNFWRFAAAFYSLFGVLMIPVLSSYKRTPSIIKIFPATYLGIGFFNLLFQYIRYEPAVLFSWFAKGLLTNWFTILSDLIFCFLKG